jgi:hypothetical protein
MVLCNGGKGVKIKPYKLNTFKTLVSKPYVVTQVDTLLLEIAQKLNYEISLLVDLEIETMKIKN